jgi:hypothetical protein
MRELLREVHALLRDRSLLRDLAEVFCMGLVVGAGVLGFLLVMLPGVYVVIYVVRWLGFGS